MLIGCMGAGGTGKTTFAKGLAVQLGLPFIASSSRSVFERHGITEIDQRDMTIEQQFDLQHEIFTVRENMEANIREGVADRTLLDQLTYNMLRAHGCTKQDEFLSLLLRAKAVLRKYDFLFYFPLTTFPGQEDGFRDSAWGSRWVFDTMLWQLARDHCVPYSGVNFPVFAVMPVQSPAGRRVDQAVQYIRELGHAVG